jgi:hypothetical protein
MKHCDFIHRNNPVTHTSICEAESDGLLPPETGLARLNLTRTGSSQLQMAKCIYIIVRQYLYIYIDIHIDIYNYQYIFLNTLSFQSYEYIILKYNTLKYILIYIDINKYQYIFANQVRVHVIPEVRVHVIPENINANEAFDSKFNIFRV